MRNENIPRERIRKGGPLVVSFRRIPLFAIVYEDLAQWVRVCAVGVVEVVSLVSQDQTIVKCARASVSV